MKAEAWIRQSAVNKGNQYFRSVAVKEIMSGFTYSLVEAAGKSFIEEKDKKSFTPDKNFIPDKIIYPIINYSFISKPTSLSPISCRDF
ncbi:MAG: hypothetical protein IPK94_07510 [Saprospiraceae bacterium]|nr:hypothetical protein [Saprospiraceae bacterium]